MPNYCSYTVQSSYYNQRMDIYKKIPVLFIYTLQCKIIQTCVLIIYVFLPSVHMSDASQDLSIWLPYIPLKNFPFYILILFLNISNALYFSHFTSPYLTDIALTPISHFQSRFSLHFPSILVVSHACLMWLTCCKYPRLLGLFRLRILKFMLRN